MTNQWTITKEIRKSQQASQGINIGNSGNQGGVMPEGVKSTITNKALKTTGIFPTRKDLPQKAKSERNNNAVWIN